MQINIFGKKRSFFEPVQEPKEIAPIHEELTPAPEASSFATGYGYNNVYSIIYNGEKNLGEAGPIRRLILDHDGLRYRSWQAFLESEVCQMVFRRFTRWVIGAGLKLQAEPQKEVLKGEKIDIGDGEEFNKAVESRFRVYGNSTMCDHSNMKNLHKIARHAFVNAIVGGDVLVVQRYTDDVRVQIIDGAHVATPLNLVMNGLDYVAANGNIVRHGIELDEVGQHVAFYVRKGYTGMEYERIPARGEKSGALMAWMVYGLEYRLDNVRGIPLISAVIETAKKMERYKEATLGSAEERQKVPFFIKHGVTSTNENPLAARLAKANGFGNPGSDVPVDVAGKQLADTVAVSTNKTVINMPNDSELVALESKNELHFKEFFTINIDLVCATIGIPPEVAMSKYDSNFSASRAALKDWEHSLHVERKDFADQFYSRIYALWLDIQVLSNKVPAPGYLSALAQKNGMAINSYRTARWVGANVPHIDPLKEVQAERAKLGALGANIPLTTAEAATESLNGGDATANMQQYARELEEGVKLGIPVAVPTGATPVDDEEETDDPADKPVKKKKES